MEDVGKLLEDYNKKNSQLEQDQVSYFIYLFNYMNSKKLIIIYLFLRWKDSPSALYVYSRAAR